MSLRSLPGLCALCAAALLLPHCAPRREPPPHEAAGRLEARVPVGFRIPTGDLQGRGTAEALGFGPRPAVEPLSGPGREALQALAEGRFDTAIRRLERALEADPDDPHLSAGLAAAFLARGLDPERGTPADLVEALEGIGRRPSDAASMFNRALALEALYCYRLAARAWERYLEEDPGSEWGALAQERLEAVRGTIARLEAGPEGDAESEEGDAAAPATTPEHAAALRDLREGLQALEDYRIEVAAEALERSLPVLEAAGDPRGWEAEEGLARVDYQRDLFDRAETRALRVLEAARSSGNTALQNRSLWVLANVNLARRSLHRALDHARQRHDLALRTGDLRLEAYAAYTVSRVLDEVGEPEEAWNYRLKALAGLSQIGDGFNLALSIQNSSFALARQNKFSAAADFVSEMLELDRADDDPFRIVQSLWMRSSFLARAGDAAGGFADLEEARARLDDVEDDGLREYSEWRLRAVEGSLLVKTDAREAVEAFSLALGNLRRIGAEHWEAELLLERAKALRSSGRPDEAARDLEAAVRVVASQRSRIGQPLLRVSFFDLQAELADEAVAVARGRAEEAFRLAESMKAVLLRESLGARTGAEAALSAPGPGQRPALGAEDILVSYWSLPGELLSWAVRPGEAPKLHRQPVSRSALSALLGRLRDMSRAGEVSGDVSVQAYRVLLAPLEDELTTARRLIVVPDRATRGVPWAALRRSAEGPALLDRLVVRLQPTALHGGAAPPPDAEPLTAGGLLAVGDPWTDGKYPALPGARTEVFEVARRFSRATVLVDREATRERLLAELPQAEVVQIASHFTAGEDPWSTRIVLASEKAGGDEGLAVSEIVGLDLRRARLVILSGCATGREGKPSLEGTFAAAGAFLAAGAREVVSTLWSVDDRTTTELMAELYDRLEAGYETDEALREAQQAVAESRGGTARTTDWAAFQVLSMEPPLEAATTTRGGGT